MSFDYYREVNATRERFASLAPQAARTILEDELNCNSKSSEISMVEKAIQILPASGQLRSKRHKKLAWAIGHLLKTIPETEKRKNEFQEKYNLLFDRAFSRGKQSNQEI